MGDTPRRRTSFSQQYVKFKSPKSRSDERHTGSMADASTLPRISTAHRSRAEEDSRIPQLVSLHSSLSLSRSTIHLVQLASMAASLRRFRTRTQRHADERATEADERLRFVKIRREWIWSGGWIRDEYWILYGWRESRLGAFLQYASD